MTGSKMDATRFNQLVTLGESITDFAIEDDDENDDEKEKIDEEMGVAVIFDDEDDEAFESEESEESEGDFTEEGVQEAFWVRLG